MKKCPKCEEVLEDTRFAKNKSKPSGLNSYCKKCQKEYRVDYYNRNKKKVKDRVSKRKKNLVKWFKNYKKTLKCNRCGFEDYRALEFHHKNSDTKIENVSHMPFYGYSKQNIVKEIEKCEIICSNCHKIEHYGDRC